MSLWVGFVASRYVTKGRKNSPSPVLSVLGIATGVLALTIIIAVMNGFQIGFIDSILEISSGHIRIEGIDRQREAHISRSLRELPGVLSVLPFEEHNVLLRGRQAGITGALVRAVPPNALLLDEGLASKLEIESGSFDIYEPFSIVVGAELARHLLARVGDEISLLSLSGGIQIDEENNLYTITGIFRSGFYEYDLGWAFVSLDTAAALRPDGPDDTRVGQIIGIKIRNRWQDQRVIAEIDGHLSSLAAGSYSISSWRDYNRAFFGALRTEKLMMFILVGLIFIVVGLNIFQAQRRSVLERREEIGLLRALGASDRSVRLIFLVDGFIIGFTGAGLGLGAGLLISLNIQTFFTGLESIANYLIHFVNDVSIFLFGGRFSEGEFTIFSPQIFYIKEIPSTVILYEVIIIFLFGFLSAVIAAWFASGKVSSTRPAEVLRFE